MAQLTCPECDAVFTLKTPAEEGKKVRCPEYHYRFVPDDDEPRPKKRQREDDGENDRPARSSGKKKASASLLLLGLLGGGALVLLLGCCGVSLLVYFLWPAGGRGGRITAPVEITADKINRLEFGMTVAETEEIMGGRGQRVDRNEVINTINNIRRVGKPVVNLPGDTHISYRSDNRRMFLGFGNTRSGELLTYAFFIEERGNGSNSNSKMTIGANLELEREKFQNKKNQGR